MQVFAEECTNYALSEEFDTDDDSAGTEFYRLLELLETYTFGYKDYTIDVQDCDGESYEIHIEEDFIWDKRLVQFTLKDKI